MCTQPGTTIMIWYVSAHSLTTLPENQESDALAMVTAVLEGSQTLRCGSGFMGSQDIEASVPLGKPKGYTCL